jgi:hypothetical protein
MKPLDRISELNIPSGNQSPEIISVGKIGSGDPLRPDRTFCLAEIFCSDKCDCDEHCNCDDKDRDCMGMWYNPECPFYSTPCGCQGYGPF